MGEGNGGEGTGQPPKVKVSALSAYQYNGVFGEETRSTNGVSSRGREAEIPRVLLIETLKSSPSCLEDPQDDNVQVNYHISSSEVCQEGVLLPENALSLFPSRHEGNSQELVDYGKYSGSFLTANGDQKLHGQAAIANNSSVNTGRHCHKLPGLLGLPGLPGLPDKKVPVADVGELVENMDYWHHDPIDNPKTRVQSSHNVITPVKLQLSHGELAIRSVLEFERQNSQRSCDDGTPHTVFTKNAMKIYHEFISNFEALREASEKLPGLSKDPYSGLLNAPSAPALSASIAAASMLSTPRNKANSHWRFGSWALDGNFPSPNPPFAAWLDVLPSLSNKGGQSTFTQCGSRSNRSNSGQSEYCSSQDASRSGRNRKPGKRERVEGTNNENDDNDEGDNSSQRTPNKSATKYTKRGLLACPFFKNDPAYFTADRFHDGKYVLCASRGFPDIARLKEHIYRKHSLPHTCSRCGDVFKSKAALDNHLPVRNPEKITCEIRTLPASKTKGLTPDMEGELRNRSKNGAAPTMEATWVEIYRKLFPGAPIPSSEPHLTSTHRPSRTIDEKEEYIQYTEQKLPCLVKEKLDATGEVSPEQLDLLISVLKSCQKELPGMFLQAREASEARLTSEDKSLWSISESSEKSDTPTETMVSSSPYAHRSLQSDYDNVSYGSKHPSVRTLQLDEFSTFSPNVRSIEHIIPSTDLWLDSGYDSSPRGSKSNYSHSGSDYLPTQGSSLFSAWDISGSSLLDGYEFVAPWEKTVNNSASEFDFLWSTLGPTSSSNLSRCPSGENTELTASNVTPGSDAVPQASSQN